MQYLRRAGSAVSTAAGIPLFPDEARGPEDRLPEDWPAGVAYGRPRWVIVCGAQAYGCDDFAGAELAAVTTKTKLAGPTYTPFVG